MKNSRPSLATAIQSLRC